MPELLTLLVRFSAATLLLYAGTRKLAEPRDFRLTLAALAVPGKGALAYAVPLLEIATAMMLAAMPWPVLTAFMVGVLGLSFAGAGAIALLGGKNIGCACLGRSSRPLGVRQIAYLPLWGALAVLVLVDQSGLRAEQGLWTLAALALGLAVLAGLRGFPLARENRVFTRAVVNKDIS
ncbi:MauE/DoxX family redox-associated membrane protein [Nonomuraea angiospora]|uniref:MauE/DoxX family redox-associated membrane protein n=1 Tax=Nonomuraea angiospora TaxID=46172 RepID=UPI0033EDEB3A